MKVRTRVPRIAVGTVILAATVATVVGGVVVTRTVQRRRQAEVAAAFEGAMAASPPESEELAEVSLNRLLWELGWRTDESQVYIREGGWSAEIVNPNGEKIEVGLDGDRGLSLWLYEGGNRRLVRRDLSPELGKPNLTRVELDTWLAANPA